MRIPSSLSTVYVAINDRREDGVPLPGGGSAIATREKICAGMQEASETLSTIVKALETAVRARDMLDHRFAAAQEQEEAARDASLHDHLTDIPNRVLFRDRLEHGIDQASRHGWTLALMFADLDYFEAINDRYGHDVGDHVLQEIALRLRANTRSDDSVSRHGGDEFLYLAIDVEHEASISFIAKKIISAIRAPLDVSVRGTATTLSVGVSIGISIFPKHGTDANTLIARADRALLDAKHSTCGYVFAE